MPTGRQSLSNTHRTDAISWWGMAAGLGAALAAGLCCAGPLIYLVFGLSAAGFARLMPQWLQWPLIIVSIVCLILVFWRLHAKNGLYCTRTSRRHLRFTFWVVAVISLLLLTYPYVLGWWLD